jgi:hypothetical protein
MFDRFGEFDNHEEFNMAAAGLLSEGDIDSLKALAAENGIDPEDTQDYIDGLVPELTTVFSAALGKLAVEQQKIEKLSQYEQMPHKVILTMINGMCTDETMAAAIRKRGKKETEIFEQMKKEASKHRNGSIGVSCGTDRELGEIIKAYYLKSKKDFESQITALYGE